MANKEIIINFAYNSKKGIMLTSLSEIRSRARQSLNGHWGQAALITLVLFIFTSMVSLVANIPFLTWITMVTVILEYSYSVALYRCHRGSDDYDDLFNLFIDLGNGKWKMYLLYSLAYIIPLLILIVIVTAIYIAALYFADLTDFSTLANTHDSISGTIAILGIIWPCVVLIVIMVVYIQLGMILVPYIIFDHPELGCVDVLRRSWFMMNGHKWKLFLLQLSFIGWGILCVLTLMIGFLWLRPYIYTSIAEFYLQVKAEHGELGDQVIYEDDEVEVVEVEEIG